MLFMRLIYSGDGAVGNSADSLAMQFFVSTTRTVGATGTTGFFGTSGRVHEDRLSRLPGRLFW